MDSTGFVILVFAFFNFCYFVSVCAFIWLHSRGLILSFKRFSNLLCVQCSVFLYACRPEEDTIFITDGCEPPNGSWLLNSRSLGEESVLLTPGQYFLCFKQNIMS